MLAALKAPWVWQGAMTSSSPPDEVHWIKLLQDGQEQALEPLIECTQSKAWHIAYAILQNREETEDALQDAYLLLYQNIAQLQEPKAFWGWFRKLIVRRCLRLRPRQNLEALLEEPAAPLRATDEHLDVATAFSRLSEVDRTVLGLREILDYTYDDISATLDVPLSTVKNRLHQARQRLYRLFTGGKKS